jgi:flavin-dependent dehydrogenase
VLAGAEVEYGVSITNVSFGQYPYQLQVADEDGETRTIKAGFVLDASGFGRVLPRLLDLELPSEFPSRTSLFTHVEDNASAASFDRNKILICVHPRHEKVWYWLIPFANGRCSLGVVAPDELLDSQLQNPEEALRSWVLEEPRLSTVLKQAKFDTPVQSLQGYSCNVKTMWGDGFALLGNAGEFIDPVFSSGVTIAMKSAELAVEAFHRQQQGNKVDWQEEFADPLMQGVDTFRAFVKAWYDGRFQDIAFAPRQSREVKAMISSILAGYVWDIDNPYVKESERRITTLAEICRSL